MHLTLNRTSVPSPMPWWNKPQKRKSDWSWNSDCAPKFDWAAFDKKSKKNAKKLAALKAKHGKKKKKDKRPRFKDPGPLKQSPSAPSFKDKQRSLFLRRPVLMAKRTKYERVMEEKLKAAGIQVIPQKPFIEGAMYCFVDLYLPKLKTCVEVDGGYHLDPEQQRKDAWKDRYLTKERGFKVVRVWNEDVESFDVSTLAPEQPF